MPADSDEARLVRIPVCNILREGHLPQAAGLAGVVGLGAVGPAEAGCRCLFQELYELQGQGKASAIFFRPCRYRSSSKLTQIAEFCLLSAGLGLGLRSLVCSPSLESWAATAVSHSPEAYGS